MNYNNNWLVTQHQQGAPLDFIHFWGHQPAKDGSITKSCFSQWWVAPFIVDGTTYNTAEHWMMAKKAELFGDAEIATKIVATNNPKDVKQLGRMIQGFDNAKWDTHKYEIVVEGNWHKFMQHLPLKNYLLNTANTIIVEASPVDAIWGIGMAEDDSNINNPAQWKGENLLGYALMEVRDKLREEMTSQN